MTPLTAYPTRYPVLAKHRSGEWHEYASLTEAAEQFLADEDTPEAAIELADPNPVDCLGRLLALLRAAPCQHEAEERGMLR